MDNKTAVDIIKRTAEILDKKRGELTDEDKTQVKREVEHDWPYGRPQ